MCRDGTGLRGERAEARGWGDGWKADRRRRRRSDDREVPGPKLPWKTDQSVLASPSRSWSLDDARLHAPFRVEKRLRPVVPLGRNRVGPLPRNRVVPFRRNQGGPFTRNPASLSVISVRDLLDIYPLCHSADTAASEIKRLQGKMPKKRQIYATLQPDLGSAAMSC